MAEALARGPSRAATRMAVNQALLIRHAHAGDRDAWAGPDLERPLSAKGIRQARGLIEQLDGYAVSRVTSSPALRCVQTVEPLAEDRGLRVDSEERLLEGHDPAETAAWLDAEIADGSLVACTHGDLVPALLEIVQQAGARLPETLRWAKGSTWVLSWDGGAWRDGRYLPPPS